MNRYWRRRAVLRKVIFKRTNEFECENMLEYLRLWIQLRLDGNNSRSFFVSVFLVRFCPSPPFLRSLIFFSLYIFRILTWKFTSFTLSHRIYSFVVSLFGTIIVLEAFSDNEQHMRLSILNFHCLCYVTRRHYFFCLSSALNCNIHDFGRQWWMHYLFSDFL